MISGTIVFALLGIASFSAHINLHGRYLLPFYAIYLTIAGILFANALAVVSKKIPSLPKVAFSLIITYSIVMQTSSVLVLLGRYLG